MNFTPEEYKFMMFLQRKLELEVEQQALKQTSNDRKAKRGTVYAYVQGWHDGNIPYHIEYDVEICRSSDDKRIETTKVYYNGIEFVTDRAGE